MSKSDFEFYELPGIDDEFVIPKPANDPYDGKATPGLAGQLSLDLVVMAVEGVTGQQSNMRPDGLSKLNEWPFNRILPTVKVGSQRASMSVELEEEDGFYSSVISEISKRLCIGRHLSLMPDSYGEAVGPNDGLHVYRIPEAVDTFSCLIDQEDKPVDPKIVVNQIVPIRAFQWLPGLVRKSPTMGMLSPTWSPRPVAVALAQTVEITGINPLAHQ